MDDPQQTIYTDFQLTKQVIWEATYKYAYHFSLYEMEYLRGNKDYIVYVSGMNRYFRMFYFFTDSKYNKFNRELGENNINQIRELIKKRTRTYEDYIFIAKFMADFGEKTGIMDISKEKEDAGTSFGEFS